MDTIGKRVRWELAGRGRGKIIEGEIVMFIPAGTSNRDALAQLEAKFKAEGRPIRIRPKYLRFDLSTYRTDRYFVLVEQPSKRVNKTYWIYAPNVLEATDII